MRTPESVTTTDSRYFMHNHTSEVVSFFFPNPVLSARGCSMVSTTGTGLKRKFIEIGNSSSENELVPCALALSSYFEVL